jgi:hypothetical protein
MVDRIPGGNAELLIMAYISGGRAHTRYALMGSNCSAGITPPPALHGPSADRVLCAPYQLNGRFKIIIY